MIKLNLPKPQLSLNKISENVYDIFDPIRSKYVRLTPEEWVRQSFVYYLTNCLSYPKGLIMNEASLNINGLSRRADTVIYNKSLDAKILIEYKAPNVELSQSVIDQALNYNTQFRVEYLIVSNGLRHLCWKIDKQTGNYVPVEQIPDKSVLI